MNLNIYIVRNDVKLFLFVLFMEEKTMNRQLMNFKLTEFAATVKNQKGGKWTQFSATKQQLKTAKLRLLALTSKTSHMAVVGYNVTGAIEESDVAPAAQIITGEGEIRGTNFVYTNQSLAYVENIIRDCIVVSYNFETDEEAAEDYTIEGIKYATIAMSAASLRNGKRLIVPKDRLDFWLPKIRKANNGIGFFDRIVELSVGKATKMSTYANLWSANGREIPLDLSKDCIMIFNDMSLGNESELDGQSYHNHWWFCREYGVPTDVNAYLQVRVSSCTKTGSIPMRSMKEWFQLATEIEQENVQSLSQIDKGYDGPQKVWIVGNPTGELVYVTDFNGFKAVPQFIEPTENKFKVLQVIKATQATTSGQMHQHDYNNYNRD